MPPLHTATAALAATMLCSTMLAQGVGPGDTAPPISVDELLNAPAGASLDWDGFGDKTVVIEFWGTWCAPCVAAIPHMNELYDEFHGRGVEFISVTYEEPALVNRFVEKRPIKSWIGCDMDRSMVEAYGVRGWPTTFVVRGGRVVARTHPNDLTAQTMREYMSGRIDEPEATGGGEQGENGKRPPLKPYRPGNDPYCVLDDPPTFQLIVRPAGEDSAGGTGPTGTTYIGYPLSLIVSRAWDVPDYAVDVPEALKEPRHDVIYRVPPNEEDIYMPLLRPLLEKALGIEVEIVERKVEGYLMRAAPGGIKIEEGIGPPSGWSTSSSGDGSVTLTSTSIPADTIARWLADALGKPVENQIFDEDGTPPTFFAELTLPPAAPGEWEKLLELEHGLLLVPDTKTINAAVVKPRPAPDANSGPGAAK